MHCRFARSAQEPMSKEEEEEVEEEEEEKTMYFLKLAHVVVKSEAGWAADSVKCKRTFASARPFFS